VNTATAGRQDSPRITALESGGFVVIWQDESRGVGGAGGDASATAVKAQVFAIDGTLVGPELLVNTATAGHQDAAEITALSNGGFVVTWRDSSWSAGGATGDSTGDAVKAQVFASDGTRVGGEILVNTATHLGQNSAQITSLASGGFVITWKDGSGGNGGASGDTSGSAIKAQVFTVGGVPTGGEIRVNTATAGDQDLSRITALEDGGFVVTWRDASQGVGGAEGDLSGTAVKVQIFSDSGAPVGSEILVNMATADFQDQARTTALVGGGFVVTWRDTSLGVGGAGGDASGSAVKAQVFGADGRRVGGELRINTVTANSQDTADVIALPNGGFVVAWQSFASGQFGGGGDTSGTAIKAQIFGPGFNAVEQTALDLKGSGFSVTDPDSGDVLTVTLSVDFGMLLVTAGSSGATISGSGTSIVVLTGTASQIDALLNTDTASIVSYTPDSDSPPVTSTLTLFANDGAGGTATTTAVIANFAVNDAPVVSANTEMMLAEGSTVVLTATNLDFNDPDHGDPAITYTVATATNGTVYRSGTPLGVNGTFTQQDVNDGLISFAHNGGDTTSAGFAFSVSDGAGGLVTGQNFTFSITPVNDAPTVTVSSVSREGGELRVNTATEGSQASAQITTLEGGAFVVTWVDSSAGVGGAGGDQSGSAIKAQLYSTNGSPFGSEILVNTASTGNQTSPQIAALENGGFVVTWTDASSGVGGAGGDDSSTAVKAQVFNSSGAMVGGEILVNTATFNSQDSSQITALTGGGFAVIWSDLSQGTGGAPDDRSGYAIKVQVFNAVGDRVGSEVLANSATDQSQSDGRITGLSNGGFVVTWMDNSAGIGGTSGDSSGTAVKAQVFGSDGEKIGSEILVNTAVFGHQGGARISPLAGGAFVVTWVDLSLGDGGAAGDASSQAVKLQVFNASGTGIGPEIRVNTATSGGQTAPQITSLADGGFVVTWQDGSLGIGGAVGDNSGHALKAQVFTAAGAMVGTEILVNAATNLSQNQAQVTALSDGGFVVAWADNSLGVGGAGGDTNGSAIKAQVFDASGAKVGGEHRVNTAVNGIQTTPQISALPNGGFVVTWQDGSLGAAGAAGDNSGSAVKAQIFNVGFLATEQTPVSFKGRGFAVADSDSGLLTLILSVDYGVLNVTPGGSGVAVSGSGTTSVTLSGTALQINALLNTDEGSTVLYIAEGGALPPSATLTFLAEDGAGGTVTTTVTIVLNERVDPGLGDADDNVLTGTAEADNLRGEGGDDTLSGAGGNDVLNGGDGNDVLDGGAGNDGLNGGDGIDTVSYASASAGVTVQLSKTSDQNTLGSGRDTLSGIENLTGSAFRDYFTGDAGDNVLSDTLGGNDRFIGGAG